MKPDLAQPRPEKPAPARPGLILKSVLAAGFLGAALVLASGCGLGIARPNYPESGGFRTEAAPEAGPLARDLGRILSQSQIRPAPPQGRRQRLEITRASLSGQVRDGYDLALKTVWGPKEAATVTDPFKNQDYQVERPRKEEVVAEVPYRSLAVRLEAEYRLLGEAGQILAQGDCRLEEDFKYGGLLADSGLAPPLEQAPERLEEDPQALKTALARLAGRINREALPLAPGRAVILDWGNDPQTAAGVRAARAGDWPEACRIWEEVLAANPKYAPAQYNLGVAEELKASEAGLAQARQHYRAAQRGGRRLIYREALARVTARMNDRGLAVKANLNQD